MKLEIGKSEPQKPQEPVFTLSQLSEVLKETIRELKAPTAEEAEKKKKEQLQMLERQERSVVNAAREEQNREKGQQFCPHRKRNGQSSWAGQPNQDGYVRYMCLQCLKQMPPVKATQEQLTGGVNAQDPRNPLMWNLTEQQIMSWAKYTEQNYPPPERTAKRLDISTLSAPVQKEIQRIRGKRAAVESPVDAKQGG